MAMKSSPFKMIRVCRGLSQWDVSRRTGLRNYRISLIENGRDEPTEKELGHLAKAMGVPVEVFDMVDFSEYLRTLIENVGKGQQAETEV